MSNNLSNVSSTVFYGKLDEKLDEVNAAIKLDLNAFPKIREEIADLDTKTCALFDPYLSIQVENLADKSHLMQAESDDRIQQLRKLNEEADLRLAEFKAKNINSKK